MLTQTQVNHFIINGYLILQQAADSQTIDHMRQVTQQQLTDRKRPFELEADVHYPGAPDSVNAPGGTTTRRLLDAYHRDPAYRNWATSSELTQNIQQLLQAQSLYINPNHHNCVMTKQPEFSSRTNWHRDTRYWSFSNKYLINAWLALGDEKKENGGMLVLPGSHRWEIEEDALDEAQFLLEDHPSNQTRLSLAQHVDLNAGDCLLFSAHCFHAAGANTTDQNKYSLVFTYHGETTKPLANSKSSKLLPIAVL
ncbi:MAG: phytanoyl-CoA dioxygenase family protein [Arenicella sp.]